MDAFITAINVTRSQKVSCRNGSFSESCTTDSSNGHLQYDDIERREEILTEDVTTPHLYPRTQSDHSSHRERLIISIDFGTTFSTVAYIRMKEEMSPGQVRVEDIICIEDYPGYVSQSYMPSRQDAPTEIWYSRGEDTENSDTDEDIPSDSHDSSNDESTDSLPDDSSMNLREFGTRRYADKTTSAPRYWGFQVQKELNILNVPKSSQRRLARFKLLLDEDSESTKSVRKELTPILSALQKHKYIKHKDDIFKHYLTDLLQHTRQQIEQRGELETNPLIEFVLCVPAKWPSRGCRRMQEAVRLAVEDAGFGKEAYDSAHNLFLVSEPEAAAQFILAEGDTKVHVSPEQQSLTCRH